MGGSGAFLRRRWSGGWEVTDHLYEGNGVGGWEVTDRLYSAVRENSIDFLKKLYRLFRKTL